MSTQNPAHAQEYCTCHNEATRFKCESCGPLSESTARAHMKKHPSHFLVKDTTYAKRKRNDQNHDDEDHKRFKDDHLNEDENHLLTQLKDLILVDSATTPTKSVAETMFYDVVFQVGERLFYCSKAILALRSEYFKKLLAEYLTKQPNIVSLKIEIPNTKPQVFQSVLEYLITGTMNITDIDQAVDTYTYAITVGLPIANETVGKHVQNLISQKNVAEGAKMLDKLLSSGQTTLQSEPFYAPLFRFVSQNVSSLFSTSEFTTISRNLLGELLKMDMDVSELRLFEKVVEWGVMRMWDEFKQTGNQLSDNKDVLSTMTSKKQLPTDEASGVKIFFNNGTVYVVSAATEELLYHTTCTALRTYVGDVLPNILYEYMTLDNIMQIVEPLRIFTDAEVFEFCKAMHNANSGTEYTILGVTHAQGAPRKKRQVSVPPTPEKAPSATSTPEKTTRVEKKRAPRVNEKRKEIEPPSPIKVPFDKPASITETYRVKLHDITSKKRLNVRPFTFKDSHWYICIIAQAPDLSIYLYNKDISEGRPLAAPLLTRITFSMTNHDDAGKKHSASFVRTWQLTKAWGFAKWMLLEDVKDEKKGWIVKSNSTPEIDVTVLLEEIKENGEK